jgi:hypothetical protein
MPQTKSPTLDEVMSITAAAAYLGITLHQMNWRLHTGKIEAVKDPSGRRMPIRTSVEVYAAKNGRNGR